MDTSPLALFITWTVYGTFLPGDVRGWRHRAKGAHTASHRLEKWHRDRLNHDVVLLNSEMRVVAKSALLEACRIRQWTTWAVNVRSNHVHVVLTAPDYAPTVVRDQLKAKATRDLRQCFDIWKDRPVWSAKGDIEFMDTEKDIDDCAIYVLEAQDRKDRDQ